jgi:hypothetical protein
MTNEQLRMQMLSGIITENEYKSKLNESIQGQLDEALSHVENLFAELREMPGPEQGKLDLAKNQIGGGLLALIAQSMGMSGVSMGEMKPIMQKALLTMEQASSIDAVEQVIVDAVNEFGNLGM